MQEVSSAICDSLHGPQNAKSGDATGVKACRQALKLQDTSLGCENDENHEHAGIRGRVWRLLWLRGATSLLIRTDMDWSRAWSHGGKVLEMQGICSWKSEVFLLPENHKDQNHKDHKDHACCWMHQVAVRLWALWIGYVNELHGLQFLFAVSVWSPRSPTRSCSSCSLRSKTKWSDRIRARYNSEVSCTVDSSRSDMLSVTHQ